MLSATGVCMRFTSFCMGILIVMPAAWSAALLQPAASLAIQLTVDAPAAQVQLRGWFCQGNDQDDRLNVQSRADDMLKTALNRASNPDPALRYQLHQYYLQGWGGDNEAVGNTVYQIKQSSVINIKDLDAPPGGTVRYVVHNCYSEGDIHHYVRAVSNIVIARLKTLWKQNAMVRELAGRFRYQPPPDLYHSAHFDSHDITITVSREARRFLAPELFSGHQLSMHAQRARREEIPSTERSQEHALPASAQRANNSVEKTRPVMSDRPGQISNILLAGLYTTPNGELLISVSVKGSSIEGKIVKKCEFTLQVQGRTGYKVGDLYFKAHGPGNKEIKGQILFPSYSADAVFYVTDEFQGRDTIKARYINRFGSNLKYRQEIDTYFVARSRSKTPPEQIMSQFDKNCAAVKAMNPGYKPVQMPELPVLEDPFMPPEPPPQLLEPEKLPDVIQ